MIQRKIARIYTPESHKGFLGEGHIASTVITGSFSQTDPFIALMDDRMDKKDYQPVGGPHPHAGFETVSLLIEGKIPEKTESMEKGEIQIMTAGSGIVHTETIDRPAHFRLFQMWLTLPEKDRWVTPKLQILKENRVPEVKNGSTSIRVYSGSIAGVTSPLQNYVPLITAEFSMEKDTFITENIPANFNSFIYVINGTLKIGDTIITKDQVGWLDLFDEKEKSEISFTAADDETRFVLYAAEPTHENIISHGPFIANNETEIVNLYNQYRRGKMFHISQSSQEQIIHL